MGSLCRLVATNVEGVLVRNSDHKIMEEAADIYFSESIENTSASFKRIAELLEKSPGVRREDVLVNLEETARENSSFVTAKRSISWTKKERGRRSLRPPCGFW